MPLPAVAVAGIIAGGLQAGAGAIGKIKANSLRKSAIRPTYETPSAVTDNVAIAESLAQTGLSDSAKQSLLSNADRGLTSSIDAILKGGGSVNNIADAYDTQMQGISRMSLAEDEAKFRNINMLVAANRALADEQEKAWQINKYAPYADKMALAAKMNDDANKNIQGGINMGLNAWSYGTMAKTNQQLPSAATTNSVRLNPSTQNTIPTIPSISPLTGTRFLSSRMPMTFSHRTMNIASGLGVQPLNNGYMPSAQPFLTQYNSPISFNPQ